MELTLPEFLHARLSPNEAVLHLSIGLFVSEEVTLGQAAQTAGLSQEDLADRAGIDRNYVGKLEREENSPTTDMLDKLAAVLGIDPIEFWRRAG